jgi:hypothetical protein
MLPNVNPEWKKLDGGGIKPYASESGIRGEREKCCAFNGAHEGLLTRYGYTADGGGGSSSTYPVGTPRGVCDLL